MIKYNKEKQAFLGRIKSLDGDSWLPVEWKLGEDGYTPTIQDVKYLQVIVYTMCGGGMLGQFAAQQPKDFYIDMRVGRLPYNNKKIYHAVEVLKGISEYLDLKPEQMKMPDWYNGGIF